MKSLKIWYLAQDLQEFKLDKIPALRRWSGPKPTYLIKMLLIIETHLEKEWLFSSRKWHCLCQPHSMQGFTLRSSWITQKRLHISCIWAGSGLFALVYFVSLFFKTEKNKFGCVESDRVSQQLKRGKNIIKLYFRKNFKNNINKIMWICIVFMIW